MANKRERLDLAVVCDTPQRRFNKAAMRDLARYLVGAGIAQVTDVAEGEDWVELYLSPGPFAHLLLFKSMPEIEDGSFRELAIRVGGTCVDLGYPGVESEHSFFFELRGIGVEQIGADFRVRLEQLMNIRTVTHKRPHVQLAAHRKSDLDEASDDLSSAVSKGPVGVMVEDL